jgi:hypothetical protein
MFDALWIRTGADATSPTPPIIAARVASPRRTRNACMHTAIATWWPSTSSWTSHHELPNTAPHATNGHANG